MGGVGRWVDGGGGGRKWGGGSVRGKSILDLQRAWAMWAVPIRASSGTPSAPGTPLESPTRKYNRYRWEEWGVTCGKNWIAYKNTIDIYGKNGV